MPLEINELLTLKNELAPESETVPDANNSQLVDDNTSQKLSQAYLTFYNIIYFLNLFSKLNLELIYILFCCLFSYSI